MHDDTRLSRQPYMRLIVGALVALAIGGPPAAAQGQIRLVCRSEATPSTEVKLLVDYEQGRVVYLDASDSPMWGAPATVTRTQIRWLAIEDQFLRLPGFSTNTGVIRDLSSGRWQVRWCGGSGSDCGLIMLRGAIDRETGRLSDWQSGVASVQYPRILGNNDSWRWASVDDAVCRQASTKF